MAGFGATSIFISYARRDATELARRLHRDLSLRGFEVCLDTREIRGGAIWTKEIEQALEGAEVVLALLTAGSYVSEICRAEQLRALRYGKCVIPLRAQVGTEIIPLHLETKHYRDFSQASGYPKQLDELIQDINARDGIELKPEFRETYVTAPPLPANYVERREALESLRSAIITEGSGRNITLTALEGMGGIGKSVLAQALCHDPVVQQAFPDGIIWVTAGKQTLYDLVTRMREVGKGLNDTMDRYDTELGCKHQYRTTIRKKAALIVVDDVWQARDLEPFRAESPRSRVLFTTRKSEIAAAAGAREHRVDSLSFDQARELLANGSGVPSGDMPAETEDLIAESGRLPLALSMIAAMLRGAPRISWKRIVGYLRAADLAKIKADFPDYPHSDLLRAIQVSVDALDKTSRERYLALAILLDDMPVSPPIQRVLWQVDEAGAEETSDRFINLSLAQREQEDSGAIRLHDLQLDYTRAQYPDREALALIHGAMRLSSNVIRKDSTQFVSQLVGRLLPYGDIPAIQRFAKMITKGATAPWLRSIWSGLLPPGMGLVRTLEGHSGPVNDVAITPDGRRAVSASGDHTLKVWNLETGRDLCTLEGHSKSVFGVAITPDARCAVSASGDHTLKVWDLEVGRELCTLEGHSGWVSRVAITPDGRRAVSASEDRTLKVWDLQSGSDVRTLKGHSRWVSSVAITPDGHRAVSASEDNTLRLWDLETGQELRTFEGHLGKVLGVAMTAHGMRAVSASADKRIKVWDLQTGRDLCTLEGHSGAVTGVAITPDAGRALSASEDKTVKVWDVRTERGFRTLEGHSNAVRCVAMTPDGRRAVSGSEDETLKLWDLETGRERRTLVGHSSWVSSVAVTPDRRQAVSACNDGTLKVWDLESGRELRTLEGHSGPVFAVAVTPNGRQAVSGSEDETLKLWDLESGRELRTMEGHLNGVTGIVITSDQQAVSSSRDHTLKVWDLEIGREIRTLEGHSSWVNGLAVTLDGRHLISACLDNTLKIWDLQTGRELRTLKGHSSSVSGAAVTPDGYRVVSTSEDNTLKVWNLETGRELRMIEGHSSWVRGVAVSPDGERAVSASDDHTLKLWDLATGSLIATFVCDAGACCCIFSDLRTILAGDGTGRVLLLRVEDRPAWDIGAVRHPRAAVDAYKPPRSAS